MDTGSKFDALPVDLRQDTWTTLAVFDGHGGAAASQFIQTNILNILRTNEDEVTSARKLLAATVCELESQFFREYANESLPIDVHVRVSREGDQSGSCMNVAFINEDKGYMHVLNLGDSRCYLIRRGIVTLARMLPIELQMRRRRN